MEKIQIVRSSDHFEVTCEREVNAYGTRIGLTWWGVQRKGDGVPLRYFSSRRRAYEEFEKLEGGI